MKLYFTKIDWKVTTQLREAFDLLGDWDYEFTIKPVKKIRSVLQNNRYWAILQMLEAQNAGYTADEWHEEMKKRLLKPRIVKSKLDGRKRIKRKPTTTILTTEEFSAYNDQIIEFARWFFGVDFNQFLQ